MTRSTHTLAILEIDGGSFDDIKARIEAIDAQIGRKDYAQRMFMDDGNIDMTGIALQKADIVSNPFTNIREFIQNEDFDWPQGTIDALEDLAKQFEARRSEFDKKGS